MVLTDGKTYFITDVEADIDSLRYKTAIITLLANGFETGKIQTVLVDEVTSNSIVIISPEPKSLKAYSEDGCYCSEQSEGKLTFSVEKTPSSNLKVNILIMN